MRQLYLGKNLKKRWHFFLQVIFLHRHNSRFPFVRRLLPADPESLLQSLMDGGLAAFQTQATAVAEAAERATAGGKNLLCVPFTSVVEYLALLRVCCQGLGGQGNGDGSVGGHALVVLAAAVSDFYIPRSAMAVDKIQSAAAPLGPGASSEGGMDLSLSAVPKMLGRIKNEWCPEAMVRTAF